ncbi:hypothetical protein F5Y10DRAFT_288670 [Nemania abortiva]|nr:hypothetical protein F5Y10DRAFT_288670 [Nemania abortiva]
MHQAPYDGQPVSYPQYPNASGIIEEYNTAQSVASSLDFLGDGFSYTSSPTSKSSERILTPASVSDLATFPPGTDYSPYPPQQQQQISLPVTPSSKRSFLTPPPSVSYKLEEPDSLFQLESPSFSPTGAQSNEYYALSSAVTSPTGWHMPDTQRLNHPQFSWNGGENPQTRSMASYGEQFPRQMPNQAYGGSSFHLQHPMEPESVGHINNTPVVSHLAEKSPSLVHEESLRMRGGVGDSYRFEEEEEDGHSVPAPAGQSGGADGAKTSMPYAQLLQKAFLSAPENKMKLQQIYQWFRENTDKANSQSKGWQNSIRHNLSMNAAFIKCDCKSSDPQETKKSTEWMIAEWAIEKGVQSTTRYRKVVPPRRCASSAHHGSASARASSGRRGGLNTSKNRSIGSKRSMLNRATNPEILSRHVDPFHGQMYNRPLNYNYAAATLSGHPTSSNPPGWMGRPLHPTVTMPTPNGELNAYTYSSPPNNQALYPTPEMIGAYGGPQQTTNARVHSQHIARYNDFFPHPPESTDRPAYFTWDATSGGGGCP